MLRFNNAGFRAPPLGFTGMGQMGVVPELAPSVPYGLNINYPFNKGTRMYNPNPAMKNFAAKHTYHSAMLISAMQNPDGTVALRLNNGVFLIFNIFPGNTLGLPANYWNVTPVPASVEVRYTRSVTGPMTVTVLQNGVVAATWSGHVTLHKTTGDKGSGSKRAGHMGVTPKRRPGMSMSAAHPGPGGYPGRPAIRFANPTNPSGLAASVPRRFASSKVGVRDCGVAASKAAAKGHDGKKVFQACINEFAVKVPGAKKIPNPGCSPCAAAYAARLAASRRR